MNPAAPRILVTGGAGFIGSALVWALNQRGLSDIVIVDLLGQDEKWSNLTGLRFADIVDARRFRSAIGAQAGHHGRFTHIFHLGACSDTTETDAAYLLDNNFEVSKELATWSLQQEARFVYASSAATYGDGSNGMDDRADISALRPLNMYAYSKHLFDMFALHHGWLNRITGLKYFNVFGPNEDHKGQMRSIVNKAFHEIQSTGKLSLFKSHRLDYAHGEQKRDFLYVKDAVAMTLHLGFSPAQPSGLYNIGSGVAHSWNELAAAIFSALERPPVIDYVDMPAAIREKYQYFTKADITKLRSAGYDQPVSNLSEAVHDYLRRYLTTGRRLSGLVQGS